MKNILLHINTAVSHAYVAISGENGIIGFRESFDQKEHSAFLQPAIGQLLRDAGLRMDDVAAVSVVNGPGSYTGLRVGLAAAKGLCFALDIPLLCISTLEWLAWPYRDSGADAIVPMIDARRMEVFTAAYDPGMNVLLEPQAMILDNDSYITLRQLPRVLFTGDGAIKLPENIRQSARSIVGEIRSNCTHQAEISGMHLRSQAFADLRYTDPYYLKAFHSTQPK